MSDHIMTIRRAILTTQVGQTATLALPGVAFDEIKTVANSFAKARKLPISITQTSDGAAITRIEKDDRPSLYPEIDALQVGQSHTFALPRAMHQRIRQMASNRNQTGTVRLSCALNDAGHIVVTRLPMTAEEAAACPTIETPRRATKYDLDRLATDAQLRFEVSRADQSKLRLAAHRKAATTGWTIRCRLQDDGSMLVYRTDAHAPQKAAA